MKSSESDLNQLSDLNSVNLKTSELLRVIEAAVKNYKGSRRGQGMNTGFWQKKPTSHRRLPIEH